jgi:hypothetical protein
MKKFWYCVNHFAFTFVQGKCVSILLFRGMRDSPVAGMFRLSDAKLLIHWGYHVSHASAPRSQKSQAISHVSLESQTGGMVAEFAEPIERWSGKNRVSFANILREHLLLQCRYSGERQGVWG